MYYFKVKDVLDETWLEWTLTVDVNITNRDQNENGPGRIEVVFESSPDISEALANCLFSRVYKELQVAVRPQAQSYKAFHNCVLQSHNERNLDSVVVLGEAVWSFERTSLVPLDINVFAARKPRPVEVKCHIPWQKFGF